MPAATWAPDEAVAGEMRTTSDSTRRPQRAGSRPILLVHGFASDPDQLAPLARHLTVLGRKVVRVALSPGADDLRDSALELHELLGELSRRPAFEHADVVAHSMGGLTATYLLKKLDRGRRIRRVVTLGTPHQGAPLARLATLIGRSRAFWQMIPGSELTRELLDLETPPGCRLVSIAGGRDWVVPSRCARITSGRCQENHTLPGANHGDLADGPGALEHVVQELQDVSGFGSTLSLDRPAARIEPGTLAA